MQQHLTMRTGRNIAIACLALALVLVASGVATACPTCKAALASHDAEHGDLVGGFFWSILFMMAMPFTIFGAMAGYMYWLVRRARAEKAAQASSAPAEKAVTEETINV